MSFPAGNFGSAVVDGAGAATVYVFGPRRVGTYWLVEQVILKGEPQGGTVACEAVLYRSSITPGAIMGTSLIASDDTMVGRGDQLWPGDQLIVVGSGLLPGSRFNVNMTCREIAGV